MTVLELSKLKNFESVNISDEGREVEGVYCGDLLSWVMGKARTGDAWITIMSNINILAVATLCDVSCIILSESVAVDENVIEVSKQKGINILKTSLTTFETAVLLNESL